ncbi:MAG: hypothetical protein WD073_07015 [Xanthobacteraceae bacterium]
MRAALIAAAAIMLGFPGSGPLSAAPFATQMSQVRSPAAAYTLVQAKPAKRAPPRVTVTPRQPAATLYPSPYPYAYPGPGYARACTSWLEPEARPSGTVIVPRLRCWWVRS